MKHIFVLVTVLAALFATALTFGAAKAQAYVPCTNYGYGCLHWPDSNRATQTNVSLFEHGPGANVMNADWTAASNAAATDWSGSPYLNVSPSPSSGYLNPAICDNGGINGSPLFQVVMACAVDYTTEACGGTPADRWLGCTIVWTYSDPALGNQHIWGALIHFDTVGHYQDGSLYPYNASNRQIVACHEEGHTLGLDHSTVSSESCMSGIIKTGTPSTSGTGMSTVNAQLTHNDPASQWYQNQIAVKKHTRVGYLPGYGWVVLHSHVEALVAA